MNPIGIITSLALFSIGSGYLWVEGCIGIAARQGIERPLDIAAFAARATPFFVLAVIVWLAWALYAERSTDTKPKRKVHIPVGALGCVFVFCFYIYAGLRMAVVALIVDT